MSLIVNWNGQVTKTVLNSSLWSTKGGQFLSNTGITTYFPLPMSYSSSIPVIGRYTVTSITKDRPDLIARDMYQAEEYWWLVYWMNGITDPFSALNVGDILLVADLSIIQSMVR